MTLFLPPEPPSSSPSSSPAYPALAAALAEPPGYIRQEWPRAERDPDAPPRDTIASSVLVGLSFLGTVVGIASAFAIEDIVSATYVANGSGYFVSGTIRQMQVVLVVALAALFALSTGTTVLLMRARRISFYVPLLAGVVALIVYVTVIFVEVWADHSVQFVA